jgi:methylmalonyl-CoA/ethylmalonyl-CoA epimerase
MSYRHAFGPIIQHAWIVADLPPAMDHWMKVAGVGPWTHFMNVTLTGTYYGEPTTVKIDVGLSYLHGVEIELICPTQRVLSPYHDADGNACVGPNHIAWMPENFDSQVADAKKRGAHFVFEAGTPAMRVAYMENPAQPGLLLEFIEGTPMIIDGFRERAKAAADWDGKPRVDVIDFEA